jgi:rubrerythrin
MLQQRLFPFLCFSSWLQFSQFNSSMVGATLFTLTDPLPSSPNEILAQLEDGDALFDMKEIEHPTLDKLKDKSHLGLSRKVPIRNNNSYAKKIDALRQETINNETLMNSRSFLLLEAESNPNLRGMTDDEKIRILTEACADHIESIKTEIAETELLMQENKRKKKEKREKRRMNKKTVTQPDYAEMFEKMKQEMKQDMKQDMERNNNELKQEVSDLKKRTTNLENAVGYQYAGGLLHDRVSGTRDAVLRFIQECSDHNSRKYFYIG